MESSFQYPFGSKNGKQGYHVCRKFSKPEAQKLHQIRYTKRDYWSRAPRGICDKRILLSDHHNQCEIQRRAIPAWAGTGKIQIINHTPQKQSLGGILLQMQPIVGILTMEEKGIALILVKKNGCIYAYSYHTHYDGRMCFLFVKSLYFATILLDIVFPVCYYFIQVFFLHGGGKSNGLFRRNYRL